MISLHNHLKSTFDADIKIEAFCKRVKELGMDGFVETDHGVLSNIDTAAAVCKNMGVKFIPGCEMYVDGGILGRLHLLLIARDDYGYYKGISKMVTESNRTQKNGFPVITLDRIETIMDQYDLKGHIFATSACIQGVVPAIFRYNYDIEKEIGKLRKKMENKNNPCSPEYAALQKTLYKAEHEYASAVSARDTAKKLADKKYESRKKKINKLKKTEPELAERELAKISEEEAESKAAAEVLDDLKKDVSTKRSALAKAKRNVTDFEKKVREYLDLDHEIEKLEKGYKTDDVIFAKAKEAALKYQDVFGKNCFFLELQYHGIKEEAEIYPKLVDIANETGIKMVATNDVHILDGSDDERLKRRILRSLRYSKPNEAVFLSENDGDDQLYLKGESEMKEWLGKILPEDVVEKAIVNTDVLFSACNVTFKHEEHYPKFIRQEDLPEGVSREEAVFAEFDRQIQRGIQWRFPDGMDEEHQKRLEYEVGIIKSMGYVDYHLIVKDFLEYGRLLGYVPPKKVKDAPLSIDGLKAWIAENKWQNPTISIGPGRGSAVGSLACYLLGITSMDPMKYGLLFERFLNPERVSMPDIDSDFANGVREQCIQYVMAKYGKDAVCGIMTQDEKAPKGAIHIAAKYYGLYKYGDSLTSYGDMIAKKVPSGVGIKFDSVIRKEELSDGTEKGYTLYEELCAEFKNDSDAMEILRWAKCFEGTSVVISMHAAGIVISDNSDVSDYIPLSWNATNEIWTTQCNMVQAEENGLLKFDFLGLKTLNIISGASRMIEQNYGIIIDFDNLDFNDPKVYRDIIASGKTNSVFQLESNGMKDMLKQFGPTCFEDLIILISMYRPGPIQYIPKVIDIKRGRKKPEYLCEQLRPILEKTYSAIVYQEEVMEICQKLAGYSLGAADQVRRYMSKKKTEKLEHEREAFVYGDPTRNILGCAGNGISTEVANELFDQMMEFARYAFNKSHAAAYAKNCFATAWLKCYYPEEFFASAMDWVGKPEELAKLLYEASEFGIEVLPPDINKSKETFTVVDKKILFGLSSISGIKSNAEALIAEREHGEYESLKDFLYRCAPGKAITEGLIQSGAMDAFCENRAAMELVVPSMVDTIKKLKEKSSLEKAFKTVLEHLDEIHTIEQLKQCQSDAGYKIVVDKMPTKASLQKRLQNAKSALYGLRENLDEIMIPVGMKEDILVRMEHEKQMLGMYVTDHPMNYYPDGSEFGVSNIEQYILNGGKGHKVYGLIKGLELKNRKKDGAPMAFFKLEDPSGTLDIAVYTKDYKKIGSKLRDGMVVLLSGDAYIKEAYNNEGEGDNGLKEKEIVFSAKDLKEVEPKQSIFQIDVSSYAIFHIRKEKEFMQKYRSNGYSGHQLRIYDKSTGELLDMKYKVTDRVKSEFDVLETA